MRWRSNTTGMNKKIQVGCLLLVVLFMGCSRTRWIVEDQGAVDSTDVTVLDRDFFLSPQNSPTKEEPVFNLKLMSRDTVSYAEKVRVERYIQEYRPRWAYWSLGLLAGGFTGYLANSGRFVDQLSRGQSRLMTGAGALMATAGLLHMKPNGERRETGEVKYLRETGRHIVIDTTHVSQDLPRDSLWYSIYYQNQRLAYRQPAVFNKGVGQIPLNRYLNDFQIAGRDPGSMIVAVNYRNQIYDYQFNMESVMNQFAEVTVSSTTLRAKPAQISNEVAKVGENSLLPLADTTEGDWYKVKYGIREAYIAKNNSRLVWRASEGEDANLSEQIISVKDIPYGEVDVESDLPILASGTSESGALIVGNELYRHFFTSRKYVSRDTRLMEDYLVNSLGVNDQNVLSYNDIPDRDQWSRLSGQLNQFPDTLDRFFGYVSGYGTVRVDSGESMNPRFYLALVDWDNSEGSRNIVPLDSLIGELASLPGRRHYYFLDIDFSNFLDMKSGYDRRQLHAIWEQRVKRLIAEYDKQITIFQASQIGDPSRLYVKEGIDDKRHHLFAYFLARAIQQEITNTKELFKYLERNVSYTSRRLFGLPQDPLILGIRDQTLLPSE